MLEKVKGILGTILFVILFIVALALVIALVKASYLKVVKKEPFFASFIDSFLCILVDVVLEAIIPINWL